ncbi:Protein CBG28136 [Caenorhabditis briggsae]|uniref:Protein CBG28136 n=1 Tax=Caenorhabditis briggsae TaxID=6238 RepID=B6IHX6_CAEBR|nr:Protein CBG28136 [Caenorhabditis briggsae]CAR99506.1 Protein CBG28136 [Caenorhabditis briggsae]
MIKFTILPLYHVVRVTSIEKAPETEEEQDFHEDNAFRDRSYASAAKNLLVEMRRQPKHHRKNFSKSMGAYHKELFLLIYG